MDTFNNSTFIFLPIFTRRLILQKWYHYSKNFVWPSLLVFALLLGNLTAYTQNSLKEILRSSRNYSQIIQKADAYFEKKHPGKSRGDLTIGVHRDGEFVKYMRWQSFWEQRLTADGQLGSLSVDLQEKKRSRSRSQNPYNRVQWDNISHQNYITGQIGMGRTTAMAFHPTNTAIFYVGTAMGGIWKTEDGGQTYTPLGDELPFLAVSSIIVRADNPNTIYIAVSDHLWYGPGGIGVYRSTDGGLNWEATALTFDLAQDIRIYWMEASPNNPNKIFVATQDGLYKTTDGFSTVERVHELSTYHIRFKPNDPNTLYLGGSNGEFFKSTNGGIDFTLIDDVGSAEVFIAVSPFATERVYIRAGNKIFQSYNSGNSFNENPKILPENNSVFIFNPTNPDILIGGNVDIYRSDNDGQSFYPISNWLGNNNLPLIHVDQRNVFTNPLEPNFVYFCNDGGVFRYFINTSNFEDLSNGLVITQFYDIAVAQTNTNVIGGGSQDNGNMFRNENGVWQEYAPTGDGMTQAIDPTDHNVRYWTYQLGNMQRWEYGFNKSISPPDKSGKGAWETPFRLDPNNPRRIIAGYYQVYESLNRGNSWTEISPVLTYNNLRHIAISPSNSNRIYAVSGNILYVKNIADNTWNQKKINEVRQVTDLEVDPFDSNTIYISNGSVDNQNKVLKSIDAGDTWTDISGSLPIHPVGAIELYSERPGAIFAGTNAGVFYRDNQLDDWFEIGSLPHTMVEDIEINYSGNLLRVGTYGRGIFEAPLTIIACEANAIDTDNDGFCDEYDSCPNLDNSLIGQSCEETQTGVFEKYYTSACTCEEKLAYCEAKGAEGTGGDWIRQVQINDLVHVSSQTSYSDFTYLSTTLQKDSTYTLQVTLNAVFEPDQVYAWMDFNRNGIFDETESIAMSTIDPTTRRSTGTITIPSSAIIGKIGLRTRVIYSSSPTPYPCGDYFGEVEDYAIEIVASSQPTIQAKVFLEGFLDPLTNTLQTNLLNKGLLPLQQPYATAPWYYMGKELVSTLPPNAVDWILLVTRTPTGAIQEQTIGFINKEGLLMDLAGNLGIPVTNNTLHFSIHHRSHIAIMSAHPYMGELYDFTNNANQAMGNAQLKNSSNQWVMYSGDYDGNGIINNLDYNQWAKNKSLLNTYKTSDGDGNGIINSLDYNLWIRNRSKIGHAPLQY